MESCRVRVEHSRDMGERSRSGAQMTGTLGYTRAWKEGETRIGRDKQKCFFLQSFGIHYID